MKKRSDLKPEQITLLEDAGKEIVEALRGIPLEVEGAPKAAVKYTDGSFKMKPVMGGWNFFAEYAYLGKKGEMIFGLTPEDAQEYEFAEWSHKVMDEVFPLAGGQLAKALGLEGENFAILFDKVVTMKGEELLNAEKRAKQEYAENPNFGMF
ncbi:hypothetical protein PXK56_17760 [Phaeobacter gallaeciensis]|uniref:hypothetical protein n=1 Tax=Phaeobacter gallaeciensis TaxID=60890 RepID=UPI00237FE2E8|nr:hypothetical protein [Phaeobacter gallaeciensis]MDE4297035.1 hypothetical protein [Phaeobacter gallaeciensis]